MYTWRTDDLWLNIAGAVVTDEGGELRPAVRMARGLGITAVVGAAEAAPGLADGAILAVDPAEGTVAEV